MWSCSVDFEVVMFRVSRVVTHPGRSRVDAVISLLESSSNVVRSIGASALPYCFILKGESTSILTAPMASSSSLLSLLLQQDPYTRCLYEGLQSGKGGDVGFLRLELGPLCCGAGQMQWGTSMLFPIRSS